MEQDKLPDLSSRSDANGIVDRSVAPCWLTRKLFWRELRIVNEHIDASTKFEYRWLDRNTIARLLMITHIRDREAITFNSIPECGVGMRNFKRSDFCTSYLVHTFSEREERNFTGQVLTSYREERRAHQIIERRTESDAVMFWPVHRQRRTGNEKGLTEGKPLNVVPVKVSYKRIRVKLRTRSLVGAEITKPGSEVEQDRISIVTAKNDTCGIAAVPRRAFTSTWR